MHEAELLHWMLSEFNFVQDTPLERIVGASVSKPHIDEFAMKFV